MDKKKSNLLVCGYQSRGDDLKYGQEFRPFGQWVPEQSRRLKNMDKKKSDLLVCGYQSRGDDLKYGQEEVRPFGQWVPEQSR